jgi:hypothetical protein
MDSRPGVAEGLREIACQCRHRARWLGSGTEHDTLIAQAREFEAEALEIEATKTFPKTPESFRVAAANDETPW